MEHDREMWTKNFKEVNDVLSRLNYDVKGVSARVKENSLQLQTTEKNQKDF